MFKKRAKSKETYSIQKPQPILNFHYICCCRLRDFLSSYSVAEAESKLVRQNFDDFNQRSIRKQITECLRDSYQYLAMVSSIVYKMSEKQLPVLSDGKNHSVQLPRMPEEQ